MEKKQLRQHMLAMLKSQDKDEKATLERRITADLIASPIYQNAQTIATYLSMEFEFDTRLLIEQAIVDGKRVLVPKVLPDRQMVFMEYDANRLVQSDYGIREPSQGEPVPKSEIDVIHVPGLAWNVAGFRIGFGGGYYDRYLADYHGKTCSTLFPFQRQEFQADPFDRAVEEVFTDERGI